MAEKETPQQTIDRLTAENAELTAKVESFTAQAKQASEDEIIVREKMAFGLTRDQALSVIKRQRHHDQLEAEAAEKAKATAKAAKK